ncbi:MAG: hypothetical protein K2H61_02095 [Muribaculaceae bacterium]|nr:hypothetical protein [Muribaculaceae bacterium]MDE7393652.1 hypothetical protein [Muribaculaceae bacterium]
MSKTRIIVYFVLAAIAWLALSGYLLYRYKITGTELNLRNLFPIIASGIIIFVPLYKKYVRNDNQSKR